MDTVSIEYTKTILAYSENNLFGKHFRAVLHHAEERISIVRR